MGENNCLQCTQRFMVRQIMKNICGFFKRKKMFDLKSSQSISWLYQKCPSGALISGTPTMTMCISQVLNLFYDDDFRQIFGLENKLSKCRKIYLGFNRRFWLKRREGGGGGINDVTLERKCTQKTSIARSRSIISSSLITPTNWLNKRNCIILNEIYLFIKLI